MKKIIVRVFMATVVCAFFLMIKTGFINACDVDIKISVNQEYVEGKADQEIVNVRGYPIMINLKTENKKADGCYIHVFHKEIRPPSKKFYYQGSKPYKANSTIELGINLGDPEVKREITYNVIVIANQTPRYKFWPATYEDIPSRTIDVIKMKRLKGSNKSANNDSGMEIITPKRVPACNLDTLISVESENVEGSVNAEILQVFGYPIPVKLLTRDQEAKGCYIHIFHKEINPNVELYYYQGSVQYKPNNINSLEIYLGEEIINQIITYNVIATINKESSYTSWPTVYKSLPSNPMMIKKMKRIR